MKRAIIDAGPLVAFCDRRDRRHAWVEQTFQTVQSPLLTCEAVMAESFDDHPLCTFDSDFAIYRKHRQEPIPLISPV